MSRSSNHPSPIPLWRYVWLLAFCYAGILQAQPMVEARNTGLAEAAVFGMQGAKANGWNPALIGLKVAPRSSHVLPSVAMKIGNNAFSMNYLADTFQRGKYLNDNDKFDMLNRLDKDRLLIFTNASLPLYSGSWGSFALNLFDVQFDASTEIPDDVFDLIFSGGEIEKKYDFSGIKEKMTIYWTSSMTVARGFSEVPYFDDFAAGATFKYVRGISYTKLNRSEGWFQVVADTIHAQGYFQHLSASSGNGVALDLGVAGRITVWDTYVGLTLGNLIGDVLWSDVTADELYFERHSGIHIDSVSYEDYWTRLFNDRDTTYSHPAIETDLPRYFILAAHKPHALNKNGNLYFSWYQGLNNTPSQSTVPRISIGQELNSWWNVLAIRTGVAFGGIEKFTMSAGFGLRLANFNLDIGGSWQRGIFWGNRGFSLAVTNSIYIQ